MMIDALRLVPSIGTGSTSTLAGNDQVSNVASFASELSHVVRSGEQAAISAIKGEVPLQQAVETVMQAERTLTTVMSVRDKVVSAYLEMTRMQI